MVGGGAGGAGGFCAWLCGAAFGAPGCAAFGAFGCAALGALGFCALVCDVFSELGGFVLPQPPSASAPARAKTVNDTAWGSRFIGYLVPEYWNLTLNRAGVKRSYRIVEDLFTCSDFG